MFCMHSKEKICSDTIVTSAISTTFEASIDKVDPMFKYRKSEIPT